MPRRPRIHLADYPLHIVQRGINREPCFFAEEDYQCYLHWLEEAARDCGCAIHAYVLMATTSIAKATRLSFPTPERTIG